MAQHSRGPWRANGLQIHSEHGTWVANVKQGRADEVEKSDAALIAAAPELLAACQEFCRKVDAGEAKSKRSYEQMAAAIEKATST